MNGTFILWMVLAYFGVLLLIAHLTGKKADNDTFFRAGRQSPWYMVAFGMLGASLSGITFVSVPGMVRSTDMTYMQMVIGFFFGYVVLAHVLLPVYYKRNLTSIYTYLGERFGSHSYKTGALFFILSKIASAAARMYLVTIILQHLVFNALGIPYILTVVGTLLLIWLYTRRSGIRTLVWTDALQTLCMLVALILMLCQVGSMLHLSPVGMVQSIAQHPHSRIFEFTDWHSTQHFAKQFVSGIFIVLVMTGLDQDMMQKNLTCRNLREAQKNMYTYGLSFIPANLLFLSLGILLIMLAAQMGITLPAKGDEVLPFLAGNGYLGQGALILFTLGIIATTFSSVDSALTALTTSVCIDFLGIGTEENSRNQRTRKWVHLGITAAFIGAILLFKAVNSQSLIDAIYTIVSYTYGPLLGLYAFGLFNRHSVHDRGVPYVCIASPLLCYLVSQVTLTQWGYRFGYELLMFNGILTFVGLWMLRKKSVQYGN